MRVSAEAIKEPFGAEILKRSALNLFDGETALSYCMKKFGVRRVLEIGTYQGVSAAYMAQMVEHVDTIDLVSGQLERLKTEPLREKLWAHFGLTNIDLHLVIDDSHKASLIKALDYDFAFIDGAHDHTVESDFELVKGCDRVLFHDYAEKPSGKQNIVRDFILSLNNVGNGLYFAAGNFALWTG